MWPDILDTNMQGIHRIAMHRGRLETELEFLWILLISTSKKAIRILWSRSHVTPAFVYRCGNC